MPISCSRSQNRCFCWSRDSTITLECDFVFRMVSIAEVLLSALFSLLIVIDIVGNVLVCLVVYQSKQMRKPMNYLLANLAVADVVIGVFMLPRHVFHHAFKHPTG